MSRLLSIAVAMIVLCLVGPVSKPAMAASSDWFETPEISARLLAAVDSVGPGQNSVLAGLQLRMAENWKVYWRTPGEAGLPPSLEWQAAENVAMASMRWPAPSRFDAFGIENYGYKDEVVLPLDIALDRSSSATRLAADVSLLVCRELCIPVQTSLSLDLPGGDGGIDADAAQLIDRFDARVPDDGTISGIDVGFVGLRAGEPNALVVEVAARDGFVEPQVFVESGQVSSWSAPSTEFLRNGQWRVALDLLNGELALGDPVQVTIVDGERAMTSKPLAVRAASERAGASIWPFLGLALIGGMILNAMPCVLPVLALKLGTVLEHRNAGLNRVRAGFLVTSLGILSAMMVLATATIAARSAGLAIGWGVQFQNPVFLTFMILVVVLFAANLFGRLELSLPSRLNTGMALAGARQGWFGDFATGAFATLLATPCSAPFLGTAVGFALSGSNIDILAIFAALGVGLAIPYLIVAAFPIAVRWLPKPGLWMHKVRFVMGCALIATAIWLTSVLGEVWGWPNSLAVVALIFGLLILIGASRLRERLGGGLANVGAVAIVLAILALPFWGSVEATQDVVVDEHWQVFDHARIGEMVARGQTVFVDVTADWCITCKANKALVVDRGDVAERLQAGDVIAMQADWTRPDAAIARYLQSFGRYGIPFNVVYGPGAPQGIVLPELLRERDVIEAFDRASG